MGDKDMPSDPHDRDQRQMDQTNCREATPADRKQRPDHGLGAEMDDERPDRCQPDGRADDRNEPHALASSDCVLSTHIMDAP
jgi:hypothetical protein